MNVVESAGNDGGGNFAAVSDIQRNAGRAGLEPHNLRFSVTDAFGENSDALPGFDNFVEFVEGALIVYITIVIFAAIYGYGAACIQNRNQHPVVPEFGTNEEVKWPSPTLCR